MEEELLSVNLQNAHRACTQRLSRSGLEAGLTEVREQVDSEVAGINSAVASSQYEAAMHRYCCLYSLLYTIGPLGSNTLEPATFIMTTQRDTAYFACSRAHWVHPSGSFDTSEFWVELASGSAGYLGTTNVNEIMRMQRAVLLSQTSNSCVLVECFAQTYVSLERGLRECHDSTNVRLEHGNQPFVHSDHSHTCIALHRGLTEAKSLVIPIVGDNHFRTLLIHHPSQNLGVTQKTLFWHDPYGNGSIPVSIQQWLARVYPDWNMVNISDALQRDDCNCGFVCVFIAEKVYEWVHGMYGQRTYEDVIRHYSWQLMRNIDVQPGMVLVVFKS